MKTVLLVGLLCLSSLGFAGDLRDQITFKLPKELVQSLDQNTKKVSEELKSKLHKQDKDALYLNYFGTKGDVTIGLKDNTAHYLYLEAPAPLQKTLPNIFKKSIDSLSPKEKKDMEKKYQEDISHEKGRFIIVDLPRESMRLEFNNDEKKTLHSILLWKIGSKAP